MFRTIVLLLVCSVFHIWDRLYFRKKISRYRLSHPPLFIIGHWRSGTTLLHSMLARDPQFGYVTTYHSVLPHNLASKKLFKVFMRPYMPISRPGDGAAIELETPQEDEYALSNSSRLSLYHFFYFPAHAAEYYRQAVRFQDISPAERDRWKSAYLRLVIKSLLNTGGQRALVKNPVHTGRTGILTEIFPDAKFVFLIRNPVMVYLSTRKFLNELLATTAFEMPDEQQVRELVLENYRQLIGDYLDARSRLDPGQLMEIRFEDLLSDPFSSLKDIYGKFGLPGFGSMAPVFRSFSRKQRRHRLNTYSIEEDELDHVLESLGFAMQEWGYDVPEDLDITGSDQSRQFSSARA